ncbi:MAG: hypothetical protein BWY74_02040 [Firmicutes bacterium ADurb.Bin419]|nr:MAG: hypothetical protein BWY74_02040 [Firmicutes bacterium ADurb.Bin419]
MNLPNKKYKIIYADPPWTFKTYSDKGKGRSAENHYACMKIDDIYNLQVQSIADDDCILFLWVTFPLLQEGLETIKQWGFTYKTCAFNWVKKNKHSDSWFWGLGYWTRCLPSGVRITVFDENDNRVKGITIGDLASSDISSLKIWAHSGWKKVLNVVPSGPTNVAKIDTCIGTTYSSWNHKWLIKRICRRRNPDRSRRVEHVLEFHPLSRVRELLSQSTYCNKTNGLNLIFSTAPVESPQPITTYNEFDLTYDIGWLIGLFVAEGNFGATPTKTGPNRCIRFSLHEDEVEIHNKVKMIVSQLDMVMDRYFNKKVTVHMHSYKQSKGIAVYFSSLKIRNLISAFVTGEGAHGKRINLDDALQTPVDFRLGLLHGILDGDGTKEAYGYNGFRRLILCNEGLIQDVQVLSRSLGVICKSRRPKAARAGNGTLCQGYALDFLSPRCKELEKEGIPVIPVRINSIEDYAIEDTYDITVDGGEFIADDLISHNSNSELCLLATRGNPKRISASVHQVCDASVSRHSEKPFEIRDRIVQLCGDLPRIELFARTTSNGWDTWGNEV